MFKVAILQKRSINAQIDKNIETIIMAMEEASENHADILLLPECFITGYDLPMSYEKSIADNDIRIAKICENAKKYKIGVVLTAFTKGSKQPQNSAFVINKSGNILMKYSKVHTCDFADERDVESGKEFKVCDFEGIKLGIMICYDREFPESARILMLFLSQMIAVLCSQESGHFPQELMKIWLQSLWQIRMEIMLDVPVHIVQFAGIETENVLITQFCWLMIKPRGFFMRSLIWKLLENTGIGKC
jgi:predicted amidohydrolase